MTAPTPIKFGAKNTGLGAAIRRLEDESLITGAGRYTDDVSHWCWTGTG